MAFGAPPVPNIPSDLNPTVGGAQNAIVSFCSLTWPVAAALAARVGVPAPAAADTGTLTTGTPGVNEDQLPPTFGRGAGNWLAGDEEFVTVDIQNSDNTAPPLNADIYVAAVAVVLGNLVATIHNRGAGASVANLRIAFGFVR